MEKTTKRLLWDVFRHGMVMAMWINYVVVWALYIFGKVKLDEWLNAMMVALLITMIDVVEEVKKKPPVDVTVEMDVRVDRPVQIKDIKTKLNGKEPTSSSRTGSPDAGRVEEDRDKMN